MKFNIQSTWLGSMFSKFVNPLYLVSCLATAYVRISLENMGPIWFSFFLTSFYENLTVRRI
jgi:hypothetical protein